MVNFVIVSTVRVYLFTFCNFDMTHYGNDHDILVRRCLYFTNFRWGGGYIKTKRESRFLLSDMKVICNKGTLWFRNVCQSWNVERENVNKFSTEPSNVHLWTAILLDFLFFMKEGLLNEMNNYVVNLWTNYCLNR